MSCFGGIGLLCTGRADAKCSEEAKLDEPLRLPHHAGRSPSARSPSLAGQAEVARGPSVALAPAPAEAASPRRCRVPCCSRRRRGPALPAEGFETPVPIALPLQRRKTLLDDELRWPGSTTTELAAIGEMRRRLAEELKGCPEDMTHDLAIARFLRGHGGDPERAASFMAKALKYRKDLLEASPAIRATREAAAKACSVDLSALPHSREILKVVPLRACEGTTAEGLPIMITAVRLLDMEAFAKLSEPDLNEFMAANFEQRLMVLHQLSVQQGRMVKFVDVRDLNGASILSLLTKGRSALSMMKKTIQVIQDFYPEMVHQMIIFNAPAALSKVMAVVSPILNERMKSKIQIFPVVEAYNEVTVRLTARAIWSWIKQMSQNVDFNGIELARGCEEYAVQWLSKGQTLRWRMAVQWRELTVRYAFIAEASSGAPRPRIQELVLAPGAAGEGTVGPAECDGVVWLAFSNVQSWTACKIQRIALERI